jgi:hypothetical protein
MFLVHFIVKYCTLSSKCFIIKKIFFMFDIQKRRNMDINLILAQTFLTTVLVIKIVQHRNFKFKRKAPIQPYSLIIMKKTTLLYKNLYFTLGLVLVSLLFTTASYAQTTPEIITTTGAGTWTSPAGITNFTVEVWGGGASGGGCSSSSKGKGASGGTGGTYTINIYSPASPTVYNLLVGAATVGTTGNGANGSFSWFSAAGTQYATGGIGGKLATGAAVTGSKTGSLPLATAIAGANTSAGASAIGSAGSGGANGGGAGGLINNAPANTSVAGKNGTAPGGGGGGGAQGITTNSATNVGGTGARGEIRITYLHINSLGATSGCVGNSITINGTDFTGATAANVKIGGTPVSSITSNSGTQIVAVIGAGTTGTVSITIAGKGTTTSAATFTVNSTPGQPSAITGNAIPCSGSSQIYSVTNVPGTSYAWTFPAGWLQTGGGTTNSITVTTNGTSGTVSVTPSNACGNGTVQTLAVTPSSVPAQPSTITGSATPCSGSSQTYSVTNVSGTSYAWSFPVGWTQTGGGTTNSITVTTNGTSGTVSVTPSNGCGNGTVQTLAVTPSSVPAQPSTITGSTTPCSGSSQTYSITNVSGTSYAWSFPVGWTQTAGGTTNSITVTTNGTSGTVSVTPSNGCGNGTAQTLAVTPTNVPSQPSGIIGNTVPCAGTSQTYSVTNVVGVTYNWTFPAGWSQTGGGTTNSITVTTNGTSGNITVTPSNGCGNGTVRTLAVTPSSVPAQPSTITGSATPCASSSQSYSVTNVSGTSYAWSFPVGWTQTAGGTTNSITVTTNGTSGTVSVIPSNGCGNGTAQTLTVTISTIPAQPSTITGNTTPCVGTSQTYSVTNVAGTTYNWTFPSGWTQTGGGTTNSITVTVGSNSGNVTVTPSNSCGAGTARTLATTPNPTPAQTSAITGNATPCSGSSQIYSVTNVSGITYTWTIPVGWTQTAGGTTNSITVTTNGNSGTISVTPSNPCVGIARTLAVTTSSIPAQPSTMTGSSTPCSGTSQIYSVTNVSGTTYTWSFPVGWTQTGGGTTNSIIVTVGANSGNVTVTPSNTCGNGTAQTLATTVSPAPAQPSTITGNTSLCAGTSQTYTVTNVSGITYTWAFPSGWSQTAGGTTNSITVTVGTTSGNITVTPSSTCSSGTAQTLATTVNPSPTITGTTPGSRTGAGTVNLSATASTGTISWYGSLTGGSVLGTGTNFTTPGIITTTTYYVEANNGTCSSTPRVAVVATVNFPEITVLGNGNIILDEDNSPITTDYTNLGTTGIGVGLTRTYTIQNSGTVNLTIGTITVAGLNASEFVVTTAPAASVAPAASTTFSIKFTPTILGTRNANVSFVTNDPDENPFNFDIAGVGSTGLIPEINVQGLGNTILDGDAGPINTDGTDFGSVTIPSTVTRTFTIQNTGTGPLLLTGTPLVLVTGSSDFTVTVQPSSNTIAAGSNLTFKVTYSPTITGTAVGLVTIYNSDSDESVYDFAIRGSAVVSGKEIDIQGNEISIVDGDTTPSTTDQTDFGITDATTAIPLTYDVYSYGTNTLTFGSTPIVISGTNASQFTVTTNSGAAFKSNGTLAPGLVTNFVITFTPTASTGVKTATVTVNSNDSDEGVYTFDIKAEVKTLTPLTVAPGGITTNLKFWLKADSNIGSTNDNTSITSWEDQTYGGTKNAVSKFSKEPKFQNNTTYNVNFNPVIHFNGANVMSGGQGFNNVDMFVVLKPTIAVTSSTNAQDVYCGDDVTLNKEGASNQDATGFELGASSSRHTNELIAYNQAANSAYGVAEINTTKFYSGVNIFNPRKNATFPTKKMEIINNGNFLTTSEFISASPPPTYYAYKDIVNTRYWLGRSEYWDASYDGDILEIINYDTRNSDADRNKIETYLAIKYGITLGVNGTSQNYVNSAGSTIYGAAAGFNYNIAGIGRDDKSQLNQKQSKTENTNSDITIGLENIYDTNSNNTNAFDTDKKFLVWGHNNNTLDAQVPISVDMSTGITPAASLATMVDFISIARTWRVVETGGDVPSVKVSIPSSILTATITPPGDFLMFISDSPVFNPTAEYRIMRMNGSNLEADFDFSGTKYITFGYAPERTYPRSISFDGVDDYLDAGKVLNLDTTFTVSTWIKRNSTNKTIISKRDNAFTTGYDLSINSAGKAEMSWMNGTKQTITSTVVIPSGIWHNVAVTYDGTTAKLYIDGVLDVSKAMSTVPANTQSFLIAAADGVNTTSFFNGGIDEVRVWKVALTDKQLRYVMNQEISRDATLTGGTIIPNSITLNEISSIPWVNLSAYYPMSTYTFTNAKDISVNNYTAALKNLTTVDKQTAPLPYESAADGAWQTPSTWLNSNVQDLPNSLSIVDGVTPVDWNIVKTTNDISSVGNKTVLGLMVNSSTISASNDSKIEVTNYLKLDGKIDLVGMSQLVQTLDSDLDVTSSGSIERDQQGQANKYNYNYWCSPVSPISTIANNTDYTVAGIMKDGFNATPREISWIAGYDGIAGNALTPMSIARYWLYKFDSYSNAYANWAKITENSTLRVGQGFTMKGSGASGTQNYTFVGKPNNGLINSNTVASDQLLLTGNPYPSALDADAFINDNASSIAQGTDGTLYFWEHYSTNNTHVLKEYQGGYAVKNLVGGIAPVSAGVDFINQSATSTRGIPNRYIPVGQGFFVNGSGAGGTIIFKNSQRAFFKENDEGNSNSMYKKRPGISKSNHWNNNSNDTIQKDIYKRVRLGFNSNNDYHRQVLLGFMNEKATSEMDYGYDGLSLDDFPNDMYLLNGENQLVIQGEGSFNPDNSYPIGVKTNVAGKISFTIDALENFDPQQKVYIYDNETKTYNEIQNNPFEVEVPVGVNDTRFSLRFKDKTLIDKTLSVDENTKTSDIKIAHIQNENRLQINNYVSDVTVEKVTLFNILGQSIETWNVANKEQQNIQLPIKKRSAGMYVVKLKTTSGELSKKIIIK